MFEKIKNYFKGLFVDKRQETLLKTIKVWDDVLDPKVTAETEDTKIVGEWAAPKKPRKPRAKKVKVEDTTTEKVNEVKPKKRNYRKRKPKADKAD
jgi:hypothetical protein